MATIKSFTSLEQSKKLAEILSIESADMYYILMPDGAYNHFPLIGRKTELADNTDIPCWSLAALLDVLPNKIVSHETAFEEEDTEGINDIYYKCIESIENDHYMCCYSGNGYKYKYVADNPVDACVAMIEKLHELNLL